MSMDTEATVRSTVEFGMTISPIEVRCLAHADREGKRLSATDILVWLWYVTRASVRGTVRGVKLQRVAIDLEVTPETVSRAKSELVRSGMFVDRVVDGVRVHTVARTDVTGWSRWKQTSGDSEDDHRRGGKLITPSAVRCMAYADANGNRMSETQILMWLWYASRARPRGYSGVVRQRSISEELEITREAVSRATTALTRAGMLRVTRVNEGTPRASSRISVTDWSQWVS